MSNKKNEQGRIKKFLGIDLIYSVNRTIYNSLLKPLRDFKYLRKTKPMDFEAVVNHYQLTEMDLNKKSKQYLLYSIITLMLGLVIFIYFCIKISSFSLFVIINYLIVIFLLLITSFRYYFFRYLIVKRELGIPVKRFLLDIIRGEY